MSGLLKTLQENVEKAQELNNDLKNIEKQQLMLEEKEQIKEVIKIAKKNIEKITDDMLIYASESKKEITVEVAKWSYNSRLDKMQNEYQKVIISHFIEQGMKVKTRISETKSGGSDSLFPNDIYNHYIDISW